MGGRRRPSGIDRLLAGVRASRTIEAPEDGRVVLAVLSDTHGAPHRATGEVLCARAPHAILHAGDVGNTGVVRDLERVAPTFAVRGNVDPRGLGLPESMTVDVRAGGSLALRIYLVHVGIARMRLLREVREEAVDVGARMVVCGHSHVPWLGRDGDLVVLNPGSHGPRRFDHPVTIGFIEIGPSEVRPFHVDCATGGRWLPGA